jgi:hypothetical protein
MCNMDTPPDIPQPSQPQKTFRAVPLGFRIVAAIEIVSGVLMLAGYLTTFGKTPSVPANVLLWFQVMQIMALILGIASLIAGLMLWRGIPAGIATSLILQLIQVPQFGYRFVGNRTATEVGINFVPIILIAVLIYILKPNATGTQDTDDPTIRDS